MSDKTQVQTAANDDSAADTTRGDAGVEQLLALLRGIQQETHTFEQAYSHCIETAPNAKCRSWLETEMYGQLMKAMGRARFLHDDGAIITKEFATTALESILRKYADDAEGNIAAAIADLGQAIGNSFRRVLVPVGESVNHNAFLDVLEGSAILARGLVALHETASDKTSYYDLSKADSESPAKAS